MATLSSISTALGTSPPLLLPQVSVACAFAEKMVRPLPPKGMGARVVFWAQSSFGYVVQTVYRIYYAAQIRQAKKEMLGKSPGQISELAKPFANVLPEFAFLELLYSGNRDVERQWLPYGYLLSSQLDSGLIEYQAMERDLLDPFADLITFEVKGCQLPQKERVKKAQDLLQVALSTLTKENSDFIAHVVAETFFALFPNGISADEKALWERFEKLLSDAKIIAGDKDWVYFNDYLQIFVKAFLRGQDEDKRVAMHAIRSHVRQADFPPSRRLLTYLSEERWDQFITADEHELTTIRNCFRTSKEKSASKLLWAIFNAEKTIDLQSLAEHYLFPAPYHENLSVELVRYHFHSLGYPTGQSGLYTAIFLTNGGLNYSVSHLALYSGDERVSITPPSQSDAHASVFALLEADLKDLHDTEIAIALEAQCWHQIQDQVWEPTVEHLNRLGKLYQDKLDSSQLEFLSKERKVRLLDEVEAIRLTLVATMEAAWKTMHPDDTNTSYNYSGNELLSCIPDLIEVITKPKETPGEQVVA